MVRFEILIIAAGCYSASAQGDAISWSRGTAAKLSVSVAADGALQYSVALAAAAAGATSKPWLESEGFPPRLFCGGAWQTTTLKSHAEHNGTDPKLGAYDSLALDWAVTAVAPGTNDHSCLGRRMGTGFTHYSEPDALAFAQTFPDGVTDTMAAPQPHCPKCQFNSSSVPRTEFPAFKATRGTQLHDTLGWWQWGGAMTNARQAGGVGLRAPGVSEDYPDNDGLVGGQEGGPLVLFEEGNARGDALVLSPLGGWFATVLGANNAPFEDFYTKNDQFTKTGSGHT